MGHKQNRFSRDDHLNRSCFLYYHYYASLDSQICLANRKLLACKYLVYAKIKFALQIYEFNLFVSLDLQRRGRAGNGN